MPTSGRFCKNTHIETSTALPTPTLAVQTTGVLRCTRTAGGSAKQPTAAPQLQRAAELASVRHVQHIAVEADGIRKHIARLLMQLFPKEDLRAS